MPSSILPTPARHLAGLLSLCLVLIAGCKTGDSSVSQPDPVAERATYTAAEVAALRAANELDARLMAMPGVVSIGIAGTEEDAWIQVMCLHDSLATQARQTLGQAMEGVPIRFDVTDSLQALPPDSIRLP